MIKVDATELEPFVGKTIYDFLRSKDWDDYAVCRGNNVFRDDKKIFADFLTGEVFIKDRIYLLYYTYYYSQISRCSTLSHF